MPIHPRTARAFLKRICSKTRTSSGRFRQSDVDKRTPCQHVHPSWRALQTLEPFETTNCSKRRSLPREVEGLFGPDGPHPFGAALRALTRWITWIAWPRPATNNSSHITEPCGRYPSRRGSNRKPHANATNELNLVIWLGWKDSNLRMAGSKPGHRANEISKLLIPLTNRFLSTTSRFPIAVSRAVYRAVANAHEIQ